MSDGAHAVARQQHLDPVLATQEFITPALAGLCDEVGKMCCSWRPGSSSPAPPGAGLVAVQSNREGDPPGR